MQKTAVLSRETGNAHYVYITDEDKPILDDELIDKWQHIINLVTDLTHVSSSLVVKITKEEMEIMLKSSNDENPFEIGEAKALGQGTYCETAIADNIPLIVKNASLSDIWQQTVEETKGMLAYFGLPIKWPDQSFYGTLCILDTSQQEFDQVLYELMKSLVQSMEKDLKLLMKEKEIEFFAMYDAMINIYNRRKLEEILSSEFDRSKRYSHIYSVAIMDVDKFKLVNDQYGHDIGDLVLISFAEAIKSRVRTVDYFGRWGGDEFLLICPNTDEEGMKVLMEALKREAEANMSVIVENSSFSYGIGTYHQALEMPLEIVKEADINLYKMKGNGETHE